MIEPKISNESVTLKNSSYKQWIEREGIPLVESFFVENIATVSLEPWKRMGGLGVRLCLEGTGKTNDAYICEIPAGQALEPEKHMYEELIYVISGRGATTIWNEGEAKRTFRLAHRQPRCPARRSVGPTF